MTTERVPMWCPICEEVMKGSRSTRTYYDWGCCMHCHVEFVEDREQRWRGGWRPSSEEIVRKRGGRIWAAPPPELPTLQDPRPAEEAEQQLQEFVKSKT